MRNCGVLMGRPELYPVKKVIGFKKEMLAAIDKWRRKQEPIPSVSDAVRQLVELGLTGDGKTGARGRPKAK
jgi:hypothetical protein